MSKDLYQRWLEENIVAIHCANMNAYFRFLMLSMVADQSGATFASRVRNDQPSRYLGKDLLEMLYEVEHSEGLVLSVTHLEEVVVVVQVDLKQLNTLYPQRDYTSSVLLSDAFTTFEINLPTSSNTHTFDPKAQPWHESEVSE